MSRLNTLFASVLALHLAGAAAPALAADTPSPPPPAAAAAPAADPLAPAREAIAAKRWQAALDELAKANLGGSADWNNLMGYSLRKKATPDLAGAQRYYDEALRIDPRHVGALEYSGELALMKGELPVAEARLVALASVCSSGCEARADLEAAIRRYKANGNRWMP